ncbi:MAG: MauE/DoxX family redox-associated membrane protein [Verrucomicrobiota bacterium]
MRLVLSGVFIYAGIIKLLDLPQFEQNILNYQLLAETPSYLLSLYLPWLEITLSICLKTRSYRREASLFLVGLLTVFSLGLISAWVRGLNVECGCFGESLPDFGYAGSMIRNLAFSLMVIYLARFK